MRCLTLSVFIIEIRNSSNRNAYDCHKVRVVACAVNIFFNFINDYKQHYIYDILYDIMIILILLYYYHDILIY